MIELKNAMCTVLNYLGFRIAEAGLKFTPVNIRVLHAMRFDDRLSHLRAAVRGCHSPSHTFSQQFTLSQLTHTGGPKHLPLGVDRALVLVCPQVVQRCGLSRRDDEFISVDQS
jgi:hypothetical protein